MSLRELRSFITVLLELEAQAVEETKMDPRVSLNSVRRMFCSINTVYLYFVLFCISVLKVM